jgi:TolB-like protein/DNA-binding winged helix-turn-helix (wHTH) protein
MEKVSDPRRANGFYVGDRYVEPARNRIAHGEDELTLEPKSMAVLVYLAARAGEVVRSEDILGDLWPDTIVNDGSIYWYIARIRKALGDTPKDQRVIETVPKKGYRLRGSIFADAAKAIDSSLRPVSLELASRPGDGLSLGQGLSEQHSLAVLPFIDVSGHDGSFCQGLTEELRHVLSRAQGLRVAGHVSTGSIRDRHLDMRVIGRLLNVTHVVDGSVRRDGRRIRVTAQLLDARDGFQCWSEAYEHQFEDTFRIQQHIARAVSDALRVTLLPTHESELAAGYTRDSDAWEFFMLGRHQWTYRSGRGPDQAIHWFEKALARDPDFALALVGLASSHAVLPWYREVDRERCARTARAAAQRALDLSPDLADGHAVLGLIATDYDMDGPAAERALERSLTLKPSCAQARHWYGDLLNALGRHDEALAQAVLAARIEPLSPLFQLRVARILADAERPNEATGAYHRALEMDPFHPVIHALAGIHFLRIGDHERAERRFERWGDLDDALDPGFGATVLRGIVDPASRDEAIGRVIGLAGGYGVIPMVRTALLLELGALDEAADCIVRTAEQRHPCLPWVLVMPGMERIADDPRVAGLRRPGSLPRRL